MLEAWLKRITEELDRHNQANPDRPAAPFAVNQIVHRSNARLERDLEICARWKVPIWITSLGARLEVNEAAHACGGIALHDVINNRFASKAIEKGADGLIAVAAGAGGHAGPHIALRAGGARSATGSTGRCCCRAPSPPGARCWRRRRWARTWPISARPSSPPRRRTPQPDYKQMIVERRVRGHRDLLALHRRVGQLPQALDRAGGPRPRQPRQRRRDHELCGRSSKPKAWKDIWGSGQGIGAVKSVVPAAELVARIEREYREAWRASPTGQGRPSDGSGDDRAGRPLVEKVRTMVAEEIAPLDAEYHAEIGRHPSGDRFALTDRQNEIMEGLKAARARARACGTSG